jgi:hypothetical protein
MRRLTLHVGPAKTGTSAVQHYLRNHDDSIVYYPKVGLWPDGSHHALLFNYYNLFHRADAARIDVSAALAEIAAGARSTGKDMVISSELFPSVDPASLVDALLARLDGEWSVELLFVFREHFERSASVYNQRVKDFAFAEQASPDDFLQRDAEAMTYAPMLEHLRSTGLPLRAMSYHPAESFVARFLADLGFPSGASAEWRNISICLKGLVAMLAANNVAPTPDERARCFAAMRRMRRFFGPVGPIFSQHAMTVVDPIIRRDRDYISAAYAIELPQPNFLSCDEPVFRISADQYAEIEAAAEHLGPTGDKLLVFTKQFVATGFSTGQDRH